MTTLFLKGVAKDIVKQLAEHGCLDDQSIVITEDFKMKGLMGRFIEKENLRILNTKFIGEVLPGLEVYMFGIEKLPTKGGVIELTFSPSRKTNSCFNDKNRREVNLSYLFKVNVHQKQNAFYDFSAPAINEKKRSVK